MTTTLNDFKALRASVPAEIQKELYSLFSSNPDAARQRMVELAAEQGVTVSVDQVREFLKQMNEESEFDDIERGGSRCLLVVGQAHLLADDNPQRLRSAPQSLLRCSELYSLFSSDPDAARQRMVELAAEQGVTLTVEQVRQFLQQMNEDS